MSAGAVTLRSPWGSRLGVGQFTFCGLQLFQSLHALLKVSLSRRRCAQFARRPLQQGNTEPLLQRRKFGAHR